MKKRLHIVLLVLCCLMFAKANAQDRITELDNRLKLLADSAMPNLKNTVDISVSGVSIQEFLRAIAMANKLNINVDPEINSIRITNNFNGVSVANVIVFLCKEYQLDAKIFGNIISVSKYVQEIIVPRTIPIDQRVIYNRIANTYSADLKNDTLERVARYLSELSQKNVLLNPGMADILISGYLQNLSLEGLLEKLSLTNNLKSTKLDDNTYLWEKKENPVVQQTNAGSRPSVGNLYVKVDKEADKSYVSFEATSVSVSELIKEVSRKMNISYFLFSEPKGTITSSLSRVSFDEFIRHIFRGTSYSIKKDSNLYLIGDRTIEGLRSTKILQLQYRSVDVVTENIPSDLKKDVEIKAFPELNSIIISGSTSAIDEISAFVKQMDQLVPMVLIEVIVLDVNKTRTISTGITAGLADSVKTKGTLLPGTDVTMNANTLNDILGSLSGGSVNMGKVPANFYVSLKALEDRKNIRVRSTPKLATLNGHEASLKIGQTQYYQIQTQNVIGTQNPQTIITNQFNPVSADMNISIHPLVSGDEQVTLKVSVEFSNFTSVQTVGPPSTATRQFKSMVRIKNEEMVILGGLEETEKSETGSGVPFLSRIPILKWFFSQKTKTDRDSRLVVIIKPTIVN